MRDFHITLTATRDDIGWEGGRASREDRRAAWQREFDCHDITNFYTTNFVRNYKNSGWEDSIAVRIGNIGKVTLSTRSQYTKGVWKDTDLSQVWEYLVEDEDTDTQEVIETEIRRLLAKAKEDFDTLLSAADKALADFDKAQEQDVKETAAVRLCQAFEDVMGLFDDSDTAQYFSVKGDQAEYQRALKRAKDAIRTFQAS